MMYRNQKTLFLTTIAALAFACPGAGAQEQAGWSVSGFGTLGAVHSSKRDADFTSTVMRASGAGVSRPWSTDVDSTLGMQLDLRLDRRWSAVVQVVGEQRLDNSWRPRVEWANVKFQATPDLALRAGRIALPMFLTAEYRKVGYVYPWVRPPVETYGALPFTSSTGVDATLRWTAGSVRNASQVFYGRDDIRLASPYHAHTRRILGLSNNSDWGALNVHLNLMRSEVTLDIGDALFDAYKQFGPAGAAIAARYQIDHKVMNLANIGASYDPGAWFVMAEASRSRSETFVSSTNSAYVSAGWRWNAFTPYATLATVRAAGATTDPGLPLAGLPPAYAGQAVMLNAGLAQLLSTIAQQRTASVGLRWDCATNVALKVQYDRVTPHDGSRGTFINQTPSFRSDETAHVASVAVSFVY